MAVYIVFDVETPNRANDRMPDTRRNRDISKEKKTMLKFAGY